MGRYERDRGIGRGFDDDGAFVSNGSVLGDGGAFIGDGGGLVAGGCK